MNSPLWALTKPKDGFICEARAMSRERELRSQDDVIKAERKEEAKIMRRDSDGRGCLSVSIIFSVCLWIYVFVCVFVLSSVTSVIRSIFFMPSSAYRNVFWRSHRQHCQCTEPTVNFNSFDNIFFKHSHYTSMSCFNCRLSHTWIFWFEVVATAEVVAGIWFRREELSLIIFRYCAVQLRFYLFGSKPWCVIRGQWWTGW